MNSPRVSIIVAMHNGAGTVERTLRSLVEQTEARWHAIIVDDASTDGCEAIVRGAAEADPRITLLSQPNTEPRGAGAARNRALDAATGEYIAFLDADDWLEPGALEHLMGAARLTGAARGRCQMCNPEGRPIRWTDPPSAPGTIGLDDLLTGEGFAIHAQIIRHDLIGSTRFRTDLPCFEDSDFFIRLARRGVRWTRTNHLVCSYRLRPRNRGTREFADRFSIVLDVLQGGDHRGADLSGSVGAPIGIRALNYATMTLLQDPGPDADLAVSIVARIAPARFTAHELARSAHAYLPLSEESGPDAWATRFDRYTPRLRAWWDRCIREHWITGDTAAAAIPALAHLIANSLDIPTRLIDTLTTDRPVVVLGLGTNGVRLAHALADRAIPFSIRDHALTPSELEARLPGLTAPVLADGDPLDDGPHYIMSVLDDAAFLRTLPGGLRISRWADAVEELSRAILSRLRTALAPGTIEAAKPVTIPKRPVDLFLGSYKRPEKLAAMIESVRDTGYPARVLVAAGDPGTIEVCSRYPGLAECVYNTEVNRRIGCTAPLNHVYRSLVRHDALFCTDDCIFAPDALDVAMATLYERFPDGDGVVGLKQENIPDGYDLAFPLLGRAFLDRFAPHASGRDIFFPGYYHLFNDAEIGITIKCLGNWVFEPRATIRHFHPAHGGSMDTTHGHGLTYRGHDESLWCERRAQGIIWGVDEMSPVASQTPV